MSGRLTSFLSPRSKSTPSTPPPPGTFRALSSCRESTVPPARHPTRASAGPPDTPAWRAKLIRRKRLCAALVTPLSGPLARYGRSGATALRLWATEAGADLAIADAYPSAAAAIASVAARQRIDVLFGPYGAGPAVAAARAAPTVLWNHGGASARLVRQAFPHVVN